MGLTIKKGDERVITVPEIEPAPVKEPEKVPA